MNIRENFKWAGVETAKVIGYCAVAGVIASPITHLSMESSIGRALIFGGTILGVRFINRIFPSPGF